MVASFDVIDLTPLAAEKLTGLIAANPERRYLRVFVSGRSCSGVQYGLALDERPMPDDAVLQRAGVEVTIDPDSLPFVEGATIDFVASELGSGFTVRNPAAETAETGGCGSGGCACGRR